MYSMEQLQKTLDIEKEFNAKLDQLIARMTEINDKMNSIDSNDNDALVKLRALDDEFTDLELQANNLGFQRREAINKALGI